MKKNLILCLSVFAFVFSLAISNGVGVAADPGPADMVLKTAAGKKPANFPHKTHQDTIACADCHHGKDADGKQVAGTADGPFDKCESCHNKDMANVKLNSFKLAAHANCKECHKKVAKEGKAAPTKCLGCHPKQEIAK